jgi:hypothetical protein
MAAVLLFLLVVGATEPAFARPKLDTVLIDNGDRLACEIKQLSRGKLSVGTHAMGTIEIEWEHVVALHSKFYYRVEASSGRRYYGALEWTEGEQILAVIQNGDSTYIPALSVVEIQPIEESFWSRFDGSLAFGFSYTKASDIGQLSTDWVTIYRTERNRVEGKFATIITAKTGRDSLTRRVDLSLTYTRLLSKGGWSATASGSLQRNDELDLLRRVQISAGGGFSPVKSNLNVLTFTLGAALNSERATTSTSTTESAEAVISGKYALFKYDSPKADFTTNLQFYPSLTEKDRYRLEFDSKLRYELLKDFYIDLSLYTSYDSRPTSGGDAASDYGIVTSLSWSY